MRDESKKMTGGHSSVGNVEFLREVLRYAPKGTSTWVCAIIGDPNGPDASWGGVLYNVARHASVVDGWTRYNTFFCVSALKVGADGQVHRRLENFERMLVLAADDVSVDDLKGPPSYVLQTSPGKTQVGVLLAGDDPDCANAVLCMALLQRMADDGLVRKDKAGNNLVRYIRLVLGQNQKPRPEGHFSHVLMHWAPSIRLTLEDAAAVYGIDLDEIKAELATAPRDAGGKLALGPVEFQDDKIRRLSHSIVDGNELHDSTRDLAASLIASGTQGGTAVTVIQALMELSQAQRTRPQEWRARYQDIGRLVRDAEAKFRRPPAAARIPEEIDPETGEILGPKNRFKSWGELRHKQVVTDWLATGYFEMNAIAMIFGASGSGKSFVAIALACCVATGELFFGQAVKQGPVFLILGEGEQGIVRRIKAWEKHYGKTVPDNMLFISERGAELTQAVDAQALSGEVAEMAKQAGANPALVVIDTLHANFGPGDENSADDMGRFLANIKLQIRIPFRCNVTIVHHSGHEQERARGSSSLRAALDQEYRVEARGGDRLTLTSTKMKDAEPPPAMDFKIVAGIDLGYDDAADQTVRGATIVLDGNPFERVLVSGKDPMGKDRPVTALDLLNYVQATGARSQEVTMSTFRVKVSTAEKLMRLGVEQRLIRSLGHKKGYEVEAEAAKLASHYGRDMMNKRQEQLEDEARRRREKDEE